MVDGFAVVLRDSFREISLRGGMMAERTPRDNFMTGL
jgi:hypothetical protein